MVLLIPFLLLFGLSLVAALLLPSVYEGTATIRIERQQIPRNLLEVAADGSPVDEYLEVLSQRVLSDDNLWQVAEKLDLFPDIRGDNDRAVLGMAMREGISRKTLYVDVGPPGQRRADSVAVAFSITYRAEDARTAKDVANALANLYLTVSDRLRGEQAAQLVAFLKAESDRLGNKVDLFEQRLADFKQRNAASLPGQTELNLRRLDDAREQADQSRERIQALTQQRINLGAELARLPPRLDVATTDRRSLSPSQQVERLRSDYLELSAAYSPLHPDLVRVRSELQALAGVVPKAAKVLGTINELEARGADLQAAEREYGSANPRTVKLRKAVQGLKGELGALGDSAAAAPDNPAFITLSARLQAVETELRAETELQRRSRERLQEFETSLASAPEVEQAHSALMRDYESALREYRETHDRYLLAEGAEKVERAHFSDRFSLLSPAPLPAAPVSPNRIGIAFLGFVLAAGVGTALAALAEYMDRTVRGARGVLERFGAPPLATIPAIRTPAERRQRLRRLSSLWIAGALLAAMTVAVGFTSARAGRDAPPGCDAAGGACDGQAPQMVWRDARRQ